MINIHILNASGRLTQYEERLHRICDRAVAEIRDHLEIDDVDVVLQHNPSATIPEVGVSGYAPTANLVQISLDPDNRNFESNLEEKMIATLAHEFHHCMRWRGTGYGKLLGEALVTEGLARDFETIFRSNRKLPTYHRVLSLQQLEHLLSIVKLERTKPYNHSEWFFQGSPVQAIPPFAGYTVGYEIVRRYLEKKGLRSCDLWNEPAESFYQLL